MKRFLTGRLLSAFFFASVVMNVQAQNGLSEDCLQLSQDLLYAVKTEAPAEAFFERLALMNEESAAAQLSDDRLKYAFWLNIYNALVQYSLLKNPDLYQKKGKFFKEKRFSLGKVRLSLDDIEHGILRRSKIKLSLGYLNKPFPGKAEKQFRVQELDNRLHFALNCGAESCPPVAFYKPERLDWQLDMATQSFLSGAVRYQADENKVYVSMIFSWFRGDFGGKKGVIRFLKKHELLSAEANPKLVFEKYDWQLALKKYVLLE